MIGAIFLMWFDVLMAADKEGGEKNLKGWWRILSDYGEFLLTTEWVIAVAIDFWEDLKFKLQDSIPVADFVEHSLLQRLSQLTRNIFHKIKSLWQIFINYSTIVFPKGNKIILNWNQWRNPHERQFTEWFVSIRAFDLRDFKR